MKPIDSAGFGTGLWRPLEVAACIVGLVVLAPIILIAMLAVWLTSKGPIIFRQKRVGLRGQLFVFYKLRTMRNGSSGSMITAKGDTRVTAVGKLLRRTKLDEIPSLWNVVKGDMSLVGPRPEVPKYVDLDNPQWKIILETKPGITDPVTADLRDEEGLLAQIDGDVETFYLATLQQQKLRGYLEYLSRRNWWTDLKVLLRTGLILIFPFRLTSNRGRQPSIPQGFE